MKKLKLQLNDLRIDSFDTTPVQKDEGTVFGEQCTCQTQCTCPGCPTCYASCNGTCDASCNGTCYNTCDGCGTVNTCGCFQTGGQYSCECTGGNTCDYTCSGFYTNGPGDFCIFC